MYLYVFVWIDPCYDGPTEGDFLLARPVKDIEEAIAVAKEYLSKAGEWKVEIVKALEPWPDAIVKQQKEE